MSNCEQRGDELAQVLDKELRVLLSQNKNFRQIWLGETSAHFGAQLTSFLLPLVAVTVLQESATAVGLISAVQFVPIVVLSLVAGVVVDRYPPRRTLAVSSFTRGAALGLLGLLHAAAGITLPQILVVAAVVGTATVFYEVAYQSTIPKVVPTEAIAPANGLHQATYSVSQLAGPSAAGALVNCLSLPAAFGVAAALFFGALVSALLLRGVSAPEAPRGSAWKSIGSGLRYTWTLRPIRDLCLQAGLSNLHEQAFLTVFLVFAVRELGMSGTTVGAIIGIGSLGALAGSLAAARLAARTTVGTVLTSGVVLAAVALLAVPALVRTGSHPAVLIGAAFVANGVGVALFNVFAVSLRQSIPPEHQLGAVTASYRLVALGTLPLGASLGGLLADAVSAGNALWAIGGSYLLVSFWLMFSPLRRARTMEETKLIGQVEETAR